MGGILVSPVDGDPFPLFTAPGAATSRCPAFFLAQCGTAAGPVVVQCPAAPAQGVVFAVVDWEGQANINGITVDGDGNTIDGADSILLTTRAGVAVFLFDAGQWRRIIPAYHVDGLRLGVQRIADQVNVRLPTLLAAGTIAADGTLTGGDGFTSAKVGGGAYELTFPLGFAAGKGALVATPRGGAFPAVVVDVEVSDVSPTVKLVETFVGGVPTDAAFGAIASLFWNPAA